MKKSIGIIRIAAVVLGIAAICMGIVNGEKNTVLQKSQNICLECIGIG